MRCSGDLWQRVVDFVRSGGSKAEAARRFKVGEASMYRWLTHTRPGPKTAYKLDREALRRHVATHDDLTQAEAARHFGVSRQCIGNALHKMGWTRKKTRPATPSAARCNDEGVCVFGSDTVVAASAHACR